MPDIIPYRQSLMKEVDVAEPHLGGIDSDEDKWRSLGRAREDIVPYVQEKVNRYARFLWLTNPFAHRITEMLVDYTVGNGLTYKAKDPSVQAVIDKFWNDPINAWPKKLATRTRELFLYGEQFYPVFVDPVTGLIRVGYTNPNDVKEVILDPYDIEIVKQVTVKDADNKDVLLDAINYNSDTDLLEGSIFVFQINKSSDSRRGASDLLPLLDWISHYDTFLFNCIERSAHMNSFLWDVTIEDASQAQIDNWLASTQAKTPKPGGIRAHNQKVVWSAIAPALPGGDMSDLARLFKMHILGGAGFPEHYFGEAGSGGRIATAEMSEPLMRNIISRQLAIKQNIGTMFQFVIDTNKKLLNLSRDVDCSFEIRLPSISFRDLVRTGTALDRIANAVKTALETGSISEEDAKLAMKIVMDQVGLATKI